MKWVTWVVWMTWISLGTAQTPPPKPASTPKPAAAKPKPEPARPSLLINPSTLVEGSTEIELAVQAEPDDIEAFDLKTIEVHINGEKRQVYPAAYFKGRGLVRIDEPLRSGQKVKLQGTIGKNTVDSLEMAVPMPPVVYEPPIITSGLRDGSKVIRGTIERLRQPDPGPEVLVFVNGNIRALTQRLWTEDRSQFHLEFDQALKAGDVVELQLKVGETRSRLSTPRRVPGVPVIEGKALTEDSGEISGSTAPGAPSVELVAMNSAGDVVFRSKAEVKENRWTVKLTEKEKLVAGMIVRAHESGQEELSAARTVGAGKPKPVFANITGGTAYVGSETVTVFFDKLAATVGEAELKLTIKGPPHASQLTAEERQSGKVERNITGGILCEDLDTCTITAEITVDKAACKPGEKCRRPIPAAIPRIQLSARIREGDYKVAGRAGAGVRKVRLAVYGGWVDRATDTESQNRISAASEPEKQKLRCQLGERTQNDAEAEVVGGVFTVTLEERLNGGDCVVVYPLLSEPLEDHELVALASEARIVESALLDWGRIRGYFTLGGAISQNRSQFSQLDTFVGFTTDYRITGRVLDKSADGDLTSQCARSENHFTPLRLARRRHHLNFFTDVRVSVRLASTGPGTVGGNAAVGSANAAPQPAPPDRIAFGGDQPGYFLTAIHYPISFGDMAWASKGKLYSFFFGPIFRFGGETRDTELVMGRDVKIDKDKALNDPARFTTLRNDTRSGVLPFYGSGARFGVYQYELIGAERRDSQVASDLTAYLDFTYGKSRAFRSYTFETATADRHGFDGTLITSRANPRFVIEGRMKLPKLPALVGVDFNIRPRAREDEPNELRFVVAFRIDAQRALNRVFGGDLRDGR